MTATERMGLGALVLGFLLHALWLACVTEDAFISFRYAQNLAAGHGLVWNPGEAPVEGYTNFLWVVICAAAILGGIDVELTARAIGVAAGVMTIVGVHAFARRVLRWAPVPALLAPALLAVSGPFATWSTSGMETSAFTAFVFAGCAGLAIFWRGGDRVAAWWGCGALLLAMLTRPEGALVFAIAAAVSLAVGLRREGAWRATAAPLLLCGGLFALYFAWRWSYFGYPLPNTFYAKTGGGGSQALRGLAYTNAFAVLFVAPLLPLAALRLGQSGWTLRAPRDPGRWLCSLVPLAWGVYVIAVGGDYMVMFRFFVPVLPFLALAFGASAQSLASGAQSRTLVGALVGVALLGTLVQSTPLEARFFAAPVLHHGTWRGVETERWHVARLRVIARHFAGLKTDDAQSVATRAIGVIGFTSGLRVMDFHGLVDPHIAHLEIEDLGRGLPGHEREAAAMEYLIGRRPTWFVFDRNFTAAPGAYPDVAADVADALRENYLPRSVELVDESNGDAGWFNYLELRPLAR